MGIFSWIKRQRKALGLLVIVLLTALSCAGSNFVLPLDNPPVIISESGFKTAVWEGPSSDSYTIRLGFEPTAPVTIEASFDPLQVTLNGSNMTPQVFVFDATNWKIPQTVTVAAVDNLITDGNRVSPVNHTVQLPAPAEFTGITLKDVKVSITDNEKAGVYLYEYGGSTTVTEGGAADTYFLVLNTNPGSMVTIRVEVDVLNQITLNTFLTQFIDITFDSGNWNIAQNIDVAALADGLIEAQPHIVTITNTVISGPAPYLTVTIPDVNVSITDMDSPGVIITGPGGDVFVDENLLSTSFYDVMLTADPGGTVTVAVTPDSQVTVNGSISPINLTFDSGNWNVNQTVTVAAYDDSVIEGYHMGTVIHSVSGPPGWNSPGDMTIPDIHALIEDNDLKMYLADTGGMGTAIKRADLFTSATTLNIYLANNPLDVAVDTAGSRIYFTEESIPDYNISVCNLDGSMYNTLYNTSINAVDNPVAIDVNPGEGIGMLYWIETSGTGSRIRKAPVNGAGPVQDIIVLTPGNFAYGIAVDTIGLRVYWTEFDSGSGFYRINRSRLNGTIIETLYDGYTYLLHIELHPADHRIFFGGDQPGLNDNIYVADMNGGYVYNLISGGGAGAVNGFYGITIDPLEGRIYWTNAGNNTVYRMFWDGSMIEDATPIAGLNVPRGIDLGGM